MPTKWDVRTQFRSELVSVLDGTVSEGDIRATNTPDVRPDPPEVVYRVYPTSVSYNGGSKSRPVFKREDANGMVDAYIYQQWDALTFDVTAYANSYSELDPIYESINRHFSKYDHFLKGRDFLDGVQQINVETGQNADVAEKDGVIRGSSLPIYVEFIRQIERPVDAIERVDTEVDTNGDGVIDITRTTDTSSQ